MVMLAGSETGGLLAINAAFLPVGRQTGLTSGATLRVECQEAETTGAENSASTNLATRLPECGL